MTMLDTEQLIDLAPGASFAFADGRAVLISPVDPSDPRDRSWWVWVTGTGSLQQMVIGAVDDDLDPLPFRTILAGLAESWARDLADLERAGVHVARLEEKISDIRDYAITRQRAGDFCRAGLNEALEHFDLEPYEPRYTVRVTVSANIGLSADGADKAYNRVAYLIDGIRYSGDRDDDELEVSDKLTVIDAVEITSS